MLGKTCRYCAKCEFIIAHQHELEAEMEMVFAERQPEAIGNEYRVVGVVERRVWKKSLHEPMRLDEILAQTADIEHPKILFDPRPRWVRAED